ncbi:hypothetical protein B0H19DRAFT_1086215 [Mycena capillaripes]|nr:hypothetical protein B0H19DRAFT_1086215 [Mycena capillaripes]
MSENRMKPHAARAAFAQPVYWCVLFSLEDLIQSGLAFSTFAAQELSCFVEGRDRCGYCNLDMSVLIVPAGYGMTDNMRSRTNVTKLPLTDKGQLCCMLCVPVWGNKAYAKGSL